MSKSARVGEPPRFDFAPLPHEAIGEKLGLMDFAAAAKLSGSRFVVLKGALARLERALAQFMLDLHTTEFGYTEIAPPYLVRDETAFGTGQLPKVAEDMFRTTDGMWLIPTAEVPLTNLVAGEILDESRAAAALYGLDPVFPLGGGGGGQGHARHDPPAPVRQGRAGLDHAPGGFRGRARADDRLRRGGAEAARAGLSRHAAVGRRHGVRGAENLRHRSLAAGAERLSRDFELLELRRRSRRTRMKARCRPAGGKGTRPVHTLNGSGLAVGRTLIAVLENYQRADGTVAIPEALQPYMGGQEVIGGRWLKGASSSANAGS